MRIAIISDLHGNLVALEAVLAAIAREAVDQLLCLGDVALLGPQPRATIARLQATGCPVIMGNTDAWLLEPHFPATDDQDQRRHHDIARWTLEQLGDAERAFLRSFRPTLRLALGPAVTLLAFHGSPRSNTEIIRATTPDEALAAMLAGDDATIFVGGHTHEPLLRRWQDAIVLNPGSVGLPRETRRASGALHNPPWAEYALVSYSAGHLQIDLRRVPIDLQALEAATRASGMPHSDWWLAGWTT